MSAGRTPSAGRGMRDAVLCSSHAPPPPPERVLATLADAAAGGGGGVGPLLDVACVLGARAALIRAPRPARATGRPRRAGGAAGAGDDAEPSADEAVAPGEATDERLELALGAPAKLRGTLVLALPPGLLLARPDLRHAFTVIAGLVARELEPGPGSRRTPAHGTPAHATPPHGTPAHGTPTEGGETGAGEADDGSAGSSHAADGEGVDSRIRRLREAATALGRVLEETEIYREVARQLGRAMPVDELLIARPAADGGRFVIGFALSAGEERETGGAIQAGAAVAGVLAEVARTGRPARATDDASADAPAVIGVPMLAGLQLVGVLLVPGVGGRGAAAGVRRPGRHRPRQRRALRRQPARASADRGAGRGRPGRGIVAATERGAAADPAPRQRAAARGGGVRRPAQR
ncbi:MAG: hypothetical protein ACYC2G_02445 [Gemmatimonadaceae bacterium]